MARAFDSVWIDGLFFRIHALGIRGKTRRLLYKTYMGFKCRVRIHDKVSSFYEMRCGIHQGGYLSLLKYIAFINTLIETPKQSDLCATIYDLKVSPLGYADDIASASTSKNRVDAVLKIVYEHSRKWRYDFNAKKSAILVYGESSNEGKTNSRERMYRLGPDRVLEKSLYDHVGLKCCVYKTYIERTTDKITKGRKALNAASGLGLKPGGLSMRACSLLFWSLIVPIITFSCELWVLKEQDLEIIDKFQRYAGRRVQRFPSFSPNETSYAALGWLRLENFIYVKKMLFVRTVLVLEDCSIYKTVFIKRTLEFVKNIPENILNKYDSPVYDILKVTIIYGLLDDIMHMIAGTRVYDKITWRNKVWKIAWEIDENDWRMKTLYFKSIRTLKEVSGTVGYSVWWRLSDDQPERVKQCEDMIKLLCGASRLKCDDPRLKRTANVYKMCESCNMYEIEDAKHVIMHCTRVNELRSEMYDYINAIIGDKGKTIIDRSENTLYTLLGRQCKEVDERANREFNVIASTYISKMYRLIVKDRKGIG